MYKGFISSAFERKKNIQVDLKKMLHFHAQKY